jgi:hypothetical protein
MSLILMGLSAITIALIFTTDSWALDNNIGTSASGKQQLD